MDLFSPDYLVILVAFAGDDHSVLRSGSGDRATNGDKGSYLAELDRGEGDGEGVRIAIWCLGRTGLINFATLFYTDFIANIKAQYRNYIVFLK